MFYEYLLVISLLTGYTIRVRLEKLLVLCPTAELVIEIHVGLSRNDFTNYVAFQYLSKELIFFMAK